MTTNTFLIVGGYLVKEFFKGCLVGGVVRVVIAHVFRGGISLEGFLRSCLVGGILWTLIIAIDLFLL